MKLLDRHGFRIAQVVGSLFLSGTSVEPYHIPPIDEAPLHSSAVRHCRREEYKREALQQFQKYCPTIVLDGNVEDNYDFCRTQLSHQKQKEFDRQQERAYSAIDQENP